METTETPLIINEIEIRRTARYKHLGSWITAHLNVMESIAIRMQHALSQLKKLSKILISEQINKATKMSLIHMTVIPTALHGCEYWNLNKKSHQKLFNQVNRAIKRLTTGNPRNFKFKLQPEDYLLQKAAKKRKLNFLIQLERRDKSIATFSPAITAAHQNIIKPSLGIKRASNPLTAIDHSRQRKDSKPKISTIVK